MKLLLLAALSSAILLSACDSKKDGTRPTPSSEVSKPATPPDVLGTIKQAESIEKMNTENLNNAAGGAANTQLHEEK